MTRVIPAKFDGNAFVPEEPIEVPPGTQASIVVEATIPDFAIGYQLFFRPMTDEELLRWKRIKENIEESGPYWATVDDFMRYSRGRP